MRRKRKQLAKVSASSVIAYMDPVPRIEVREALAGPFGRLMASARYANLASKGVKTAEVETGKPG